MATSQYAVSSEILIRIIYEQQKPPDYFTQMGVQALIYVDSVEPMKLLKIDDILHQIIGIFHFWIINLKSS